MLVIKFGGASVKDAKGMQNVVNIIKKYTTEPLLIVVSAMDKTTNALEKLTHLATQGNRNETMKQLEKIKSFHKNIVIQLFNENSNPILSDIEPYFEELNKIVEGILLLGDYPNRIFDRVMSYGELISSKILFSFCQFSDLETHWLDVRKILITDAHHRQASIIQHLTEQKIQYEVEPLLNAGQVVITQGFIAATNEGHTTTLGREGSDYSAAIFAEALNARELLIWKDVPAIFNADPRYFNELTALQHISYKNAIEMTFYGATVLHPKTIKPLCNKNIPLKVRSFNELETIGTTIQSGNPQDTIPCFLIKPNQTLLIITRMELSFINSTDMQEVMDALSLAFLSINLIQLSATSLTLCVDNQTDDIQLFQSSLAENYLIKIIHQLQLRTTLNFNNIDVDYTAVLLFQKDEKNIYLVERSQ